MLRALRTLLRYLRRLMPGLLGADAVSQETLDNIFAARTQAQTAAQQAQTARQGAESARDETQAIRQQAVAETTLLRDQTAAIRDVTETIKQTAIVATDAIRVQTGQIRDDAVHQVQQGLSDLGQQHQSAMIDLVTIKGETQGIKDSALQQTGAIRDQAAGHRDKARDWAASGAGTVVEPVPPDAQAGTEPLYSARHYADRSRRWAAHPPTQPVEGGLFSARHYAEAAQQWAQQAQQAQQTSLSEARTFLGACSALGLLAPEYTHTNFLPAGGSPHQSGQTAHADGTFSLAPGGLLGFPLQLAGQTAYQISAFVAVLTGGAEVTLTLEVPFGSIHHQAQRLAFAGGPELRVLTLPWLEAQTTSVSVVLRNTSSLITARVTMPRVANGLIPLKPPVSTGQSAA